MILFYQNTSVKPPTQQQIIDTVIQFNQNEVGSLNQTLNTEFPEITLSQNLTKILNTIQFNGKKNYYTFLNSIKEKALLNINKTK